MERRLGRGLDSLLSSRSSQPSPALTPERTSADEGSDATSQRSAGRASSGPAAEFLPTHAIQPNPFQPRKHFDEEALEELASSLKNHGMLQAVVVRRVAEGFQLIAGERRWRAARLAGMAQIPAIVRDNVAEDQMLEWAMVENLQRRDLDPIERALGYQLMIEKLALTQEGVAERVGLKRSTVTNHLRLLELDASTQALLVEGTLSMGHARALLAISNAEAQRALAQEVVHNGMSVRDVERRIREGAGAPASSGNSSGSAVRPLPLPGILAGSQTPTPPPAWVADMERRVREHLGTRVEVKNGPGYRGQIVIHYDSREDLERVYALIAPNVRV